MASSAERLGKFTLADDRVHPSFSTVSRIAPFALFCVRFKGDRTCRLRAAGVCQLGYPRSRGAFTTVTFPPEAAQQLTPLGRTKVRQTSSRSAMKPSV